jgi:hypothetical protein
MRRQRDRLLKAALRARFLVTLTDGLTVDGLLVDVDDRTLILAAASNVGQDGTRTPIDGMVYLPRASVAYLQRP